MYLGLNTRPTGTTTETALGNIGIYGVEIAITGRWPLRFLKVKQMRLNREQRQINAKLFQEYPGTTVAFWHTMLFVYPP